MARLKGKVISKPLALTPMLGVQAFYGNKIYKYAGIVNRHYVFIGVKDHQDQLTASDPASKLKELFIEFPVGVTLKDGTLCTTIPLKYSQWQAAIDNGEVDSNKEVEFEIISTPFKQPANPIHGISWSKAQLDAGEDLTIIKIAKIIPTKKRLYNEDEVMNIASGSILPWA
jgi:hypothetical protein